MSQEDIVLEYGKSMISFRVRESVVDSQGVSDAEDARNRALGELQNASMEWQRAEVKCEGDHRIRPGMRVTLKYVGERFSGEYVAERVNHEFSAEGFITEVFLRRNMLPGEPKLASAIDDEREKQHNSAGARGGDTADGGSSGVVEDSAQEAGAEQETASEPDSAAGESTVKPENQEMSFEEKFEFVKGRAYATDVSMQRYDAATGIIVKESKAFNCIGLVTYLYDVKANYDVAHFDRYEQFMKLTDMKSRSDLKPGDIIRWCGSNAEGVNNHVQIWRGDNITWESCYGKGVSIRTNYSGYENWYKRNYPNCQITFDRKRT